MKLSNTGKYTLKVHIYNFLLSCLSIHAIWAEKKNFRLPRCFIGFLANFKTYLPSSFEQDITINLVWRFRFGCCAYLCPSLQYFMLFYNLHSFVRVLQTSGRLYADYKTKHNNHSFCILCMIPSNLQQFPLVYKSKNI